MRRLARHHIGRRHPRRRIGEGAASRPSRSGRPSSALGPKMFSPSLRVKPGRPADVEGQDLVPAMDPLARQLRPASPGDSTVRAVQHPAVGHDAMIRARSRAVPCRLAEGISIVRHSAEPRPPGAEPLSRKAARLDRIDGAQIGRRRRLPHLRHPAVLGSRAGRSTGRGRRAKSSRSAVPMLRPSTIRNSSPAR